MSDINNIEKFIDKILNKPKWKDPELQFYNLLKKKVKQYEQLLETYELVLEKRDIIDNIHDQIWFKESKFQNALNSFLNEMEIESYNTEMQDNYIDTRLLVKFPKSKFTLNASYNLEWNDNVKKMKFYFYLEDFGQVNQAYIAYNDYTDDNNTQIKLPEISKVYNIIKIGAPISKIELLKLFTEIVLYYDESTLISKSYIGKQFPITLTYLLKL